MENLLQNSGKDLHKKLATELRMIVSESLALMEGINAIENSTIIEESTTTPTLSGSFANVTILPPRRKKALTRSTVIGQLLNHTFSIPKDSIISKVNMDELPNLDGKSREHHFIFSDRLKGWNIERRRRANNKMYDMSYHHLVSNKTFRSIVEVVDFLLYEIYPTPQRKMEDGTVLGESSTKKRKKNSALCDERKKVLSLNMTKEDIENFMTDAFEIFQEGAYGEESEIDKDFKYSDNFIFRDNKNFIDSNIKEDQERNNIENSNVERENGGVRQNSIDVPHDMTTTQEIMVTPKTNATEVEANGIQVQQTTMEAKHQSKTVNEPQAAQKETQDQAIWEAFPNIMNERQEIQDQATWETFPNIVNERQEIQDQATWETFPNFINQSLEEGRQIDAAAKAIAKALEKLPDNM